MEPLGDVAVLLLLLLLSFAFSGGEVALFSIPEREIEKIRPHIFRNFLKKLRANPNLLLTLILTSNTAVNSFASSIFAVLFATLLFWLTEPIKSITGIITFTIILLTVSEISPKAIALTFPKRFAQWVSYLLIPVYILLFPVLVPFSWFLNKLLNLVPLPAEPITEEEIKQVVNSMSIKSSKLRLLERGVIFLNHSVKDIGTPLVDLKALSEDTTVAKAIDIYKSTRYSRFPVYRQKLDNIIGILEIKRIINVEDLTMPISGFLDKPVFVPSTANILSALRTLREENKKMAIVVDEYGGTWGILTLGDITKFFFGTIYIETEEEPELVKKVSDRVFIVPADIDLRVLRDTTGINFGDEGKLSTLIVEKLGKIPREGEGFEIQGVTIVVLSKEGENLEKVRLEVKHG